MKKTVLLTVAVLALLSCNKIVTPEETEVKKPKNIILMIGDGTGLSQISAAQYFGKTPSNYTRFPITGLINTSSESDLITDSAAGATAFASGIRTYNGAIGVDVDTTKVQNMVELVSQKGMQTGLIATSSITHATPACFFAHSKSRDFHEEIAAQLPTSEINFFAGAGLQYFNKREDGKNLLDDFSENGFSIDTLKLEAMPNAKKAGYLLADKSMPKAMEGRGNFLKDASLLAVQRLSQNEKGFFMMVEGSQIDWGGHDNDAPYLISELLDFDSTIGAILDFAEKNGETLVVVTADHETGGFTLASDGDDYNSIQPTFSTHGHSATMVPVFAYGPGAEIFSGIYKNSEIFHKIKTLLQE
ncbi:MAG TPA: alkaline phosphatase [Flavobacteriaceae bacterium]|nr:alkaline phosphatase [Flavobacteriaceae bacterium]MCB9212862.1 alkaline phosphatase [Alteromonas sp.]HPF11466.1 alkaline phosphatase [Flavobacteriaceae bacterium]HQU20629.1 alkaline phosphatase [Flavobacteriaceae bacterium]HQU65048.1 alkaline phosphatase [Flavobacteriaceae bacterium]